MNVRFASEPAVTAGAVRSVVSFSHIAGGLFITTTGAPGLALITTFPVAGDVQPEAFVTANVNVPGSRPETVRVVPVPWLVKPSGYRMSVHVPLAGSPDSTTLPVGTRKVGWVIVPTTGAVGVGG